MPTADAQVLPGGTVYISDVGMVGLKDSIIGIDKEPILKNFLTQMPVKHTIATEGTAVFGAVFLELLEKNKVEQVLREVEL